VVISIELALRGTEEPLFLQTKRLADLRLELGNSAVSTNLMLLLYLILNIKSYLMIPGSDVVKRSFGRLF
jgi:hypothetical protein